MLTTLRSKGVFCALCAVLVLPGVFLLRAKPERPLSLPVAQPIAADKQSATTKVSDAKRKEVRDAVAGMPLAFEPNKGQTQPEVKFISRGEGYTFYLTPTESVMVLRKGAKVGVQPAVLRLSLLNANSEAPLSGIDELPGKTSYFKGATAYTDLDNYAKVREQNVYPGIDLVYYGNNRQLEYDFVVAPGADPAAIQFSVDGAQNVEIDPHGDLLLQFNQGIVRHKSPVIYQEINGEKRSVEGHYVLHKDEGCDPALPSVSFEVAEYDDSKPLIIDPILRFATVFGDQHDTDHSGDDGGNGIAIDSIGNVYITGFTSSIEFLPIQGALITRADPFTLSHPEFDYDAFVTKFTPDLSAASYSTYLGGANRGFLQGGSPPGTPLVPPPAVPGVHTGDDVGIGIAVDGQFNMYITGNTFSSDFPVKNALSTYSGNGDVFLTKLSSGGNNIVFSTYLGGSSLDVVNAITLDPSGNIYLAGTTMSSNFRIANAIQPVYGGGTTDGFLAKFSGDGSVLLYSTFVGGGGDDECKGVITDASSSAYVCGSTSSDDFPIFNALQVSRAGALDGYVMKLNSSGDVKVFSTYIGGTGDDIANGIAVDSTGNVYIAGSSTSTDYPTVSPTVLPIQSTNNGLQDAFATKFDRFGSSLIFSTYLGGSGNDEAKTIAVDSRNAIYIAGVTDSPNFPVAPSTNTLQPGLAGGKDGFIAKFNPTGVPLVYSTYFGSDVHNMITDNDYQEVQDPITGLFSPQYNPNPLNLNLPTDDQVTALVVDGNGNAYVTGFTNGGFYHTFGAFTTGGGEDFPAPFHLVTTDGVGNVYKAPLEAGPDRDLNDAYAAVIQDSSPIITSPNTAQGTLGANFNYLITATNNPQSFNAAGLPLGLSVSTSTGQIAGVPQITGNFKVILTATNASGTGAQFLFLNISTLPPTINSSLTATGTVGNVFRYTITATNDPGSFTALNLPQGLSLDNISGFISGVPVIEGIFNVPITATNAVGSDSKTLQITILPAVPVVNSPVNAQGVLNQSFTYTVTATNNPTSFGASGLPNGLSIDQRSGIISGVPTQQGAFSVTLSASNGGGTGFMTLNLQIIQAALPVISSPIAATATINVPFSFTITANNNTLSYGATGLPPGLTLNNQTGVISGVVPPGGTGVYAATQTATNAAGTASKALTITVNDPAPPVITSPATVTGSAGVQFRYDISATNNPTSFATTIGGVAQFSSTRPQPVVIDFATDGAAVTSSPQLNGFVCSNLIGNTFPLVGRPLTMQTGGLAGQIRLITSFDTLTGTIFLNSPYSSLPAVNDQFSINTGVISGTFTGAVSTTFDVSATNTGGTGNLTVTLNVSALQVPVVTSPNSASGVVGLEFTYQIVATNSPTSYTVVSGLGAPGTVLTGVGDGAVADVNGTITSGLTANTFTTPSLTALFNQGVNIVGLQIEVPATSSLGVSNVRTISTYDNTTSKVTVSTPFVNSIGIQKALTNTDTFIIHGLIIGVPTTPGTFTPIVLRAANAAGNSPDLNLTLNIQGPVVPNIILPPPDPNTGVPTIYGNDGAPIPSFQLQATGTQPVTFYVANINQWDDAVTGLPGLVQNGSFIQGTPRKPLTADVDIYAFNAATAPSTSDFQAHSPWPATAKKTLRIVISATPPTIQNVNPTNTINGAVGSTLGTLLPNGKTGVQITATGTAIINLTSTTPPPGITFTADTDPITGQLTGTGTFSGTPTASAIGDTTVTVTASNSQIVPGGGTTSKNFIFHILPQPPVITSPLTAAGTDGVPFTYTITATGSPPININATNLPTGLIFSASTNTITGTPTTGAIGSTNVTLTASNNAGTDTKTLVIAISPASPSVNSPQTATAQEGQQFTYTITATGTPPFTFSAAPTPPAPGLSLAGAVISGIPPSGSAGTYNISIGAQNNIGSDAKVLILTILPAPPVIQGVTISQPFVNNVPQLSISIPDGTVFSSSIVSTGSQPITYSAVGLTTLGLSLSGSTISGTPNKTGTFAIQLNALNAQGADHKVLVIDVVPTPPTVIAPVTPPTIIGTPNVPFGPTGQGLQLQASGSGATTGGISFQVSGLPPTLGLTFDGVDKIVGTPQFTTAALFPPNGDFPVTITAINSVGQSAPHVITIRIEQTPPTIQSISNPDLPGQFVITLKDGVPLANQLQHQVVAVGSPQITYALTSIFTNPLPGSNVTNTLGIAIDSNTGMLTGTAVGVGAYTATVTATNGQGSDTKQITINVTRTPPTFFMTGPDSLTVQVGTAVSYPPQQPFVTGSAPITITASNVPPGLSFDPNTMVLSGSPTQAGVSDITFSASNGTTTTFTLHLTVTGLIPVVNSATTANMIVGQPFTPGYSITATNVPTGFTAANLPPGLTLTVTPGGGATPATGVISGTPTQAGTFDVILNAFNSGGISPDFHVTMNVTSGAPIITNALNVTGYLGVQFTPFQLTAFGLPTITITASPNPPAPGLTISNDTITGIPTVEGVYTITETASNSTGTDKQTLVITILAHPEDTDGDGFPDELEIAMGTDPNSASSTPFTGNAPAGTIQKINITNMQIKLNFTATGASKDSISIKGTLPLGAGANIPGQNLDLVIGGIRASFTPLNARGQGSISSPPAKFTLKSSPLAEDAKFTAKLGPSNFKAALADEGLVNEIAVNQSRQVRVFVIFKNTVYESKKLTTWNARLNKSGTAKATKPDVAP